MDLKSREIYEAPGAKIILAVHKDIEGMTLTKQQVAFKKTVDQTWASLVYHGEWFQPLKADLDAFIASTQSVVTGTWTVTLYKGNIDIIEARVSRVALQAGATLDRQQRLQPATLRPGRLHQGPAVPGPRPPRR